VGKNWKIGAVALLLLALLLALPLMTRYRKPTSLAQTDLGDGRILRVEGVSFGKIHDIGFESPITRYFGPWLPSRISQLLQSPVPRNVMTLDRDALVVWVNAISSTTGTNVDCQGLGIDFIDPNGNVFAEDHPSWYGGVNFWREGHAFYSFPRSTETLTVRARLWDKTNFLLMTVPNPGYRKPLDWTGEPLPQKQVIGDYTIILTSLKEATTTEKWRSTALYWEPQFELWWKGNKQEAGWNLEWAAEDRYGNQGKELGRSEPVLKFSATFHPEATNVNAAVVLGALPKITLTNLTTAPLNVSFTNQGCTISVLAFLPAGVYTFSEAGEYLTNAPTTFTAVRGGSKTGWMSQSRRMTPTRVVTWFGHYTDVPVIYVKVSDPSFKDRLGLRFKGDANLFYGAEREEQGTSSGVVPFMFRVPDEVKSVDPELVMLPPLKAEFTVKTPAAQK
jgi:hypothetical protein